MKEHRPKILKKCKRGLLISRGKDEFLSKVNVAQMGAEVANELRGQSWD